MQNLSWISRDVNDVCMTGSIKGPFACSANSGNKKEFKNSKECDLLVFCPPFNLSEQVAFE